MVYYVPMLAKTIHAMKPITSSTKITTPQIPILRIPPKNLKASQPNTTTPITPRIIPIEIPPSAPRFSQLVRLMMKIQNRLLMLIFFTAQKFDVYNKYRTNTFR